jgi:hypothetical protein
VDPTPGREEFETKLSLLLFLMNSEEEPNTNDNISLLVHSSTPLSLTGESREYLLLIPIQSLIPPQPILLYA